MSESISFPQFKKFGERLRVLRAVRGLSQIQLRDEMEQYCGVTISQPYISELERGNKPPSLPVSTAMAEVLDVPLDYLLGEHTPEIAGQPHA